jgi:hypothetical protein
MEGKLRKRAWVLLLNLPYEDLNFLIIGQWSPDCGSFRSGRAVGNNSALAGT